MQVMDAYAEGPLDAGKLLLTLNDHKDGVFTSLTATASFVSADAADEFLSALPKTARRRVFVLKNRPLAPFLVASDVRTQTPTVLPGFFRFVRAAAAAGFVPVARIVPAERRSAFCTYPELEDYAATFAGII